MAEIDQSKMIANINRKRTIVMYLCIGICIILVILAILTYSDQQALNALNKNITEAFKTCDPAVVCKMSYPECFKGVVLNG